MMWLCFCNDVCTAQRIPATAYTRPEDSLERGTRLGEAHVEGAKYHFLLLVFLN